MNTNNKLKYKITYFSINDVSKLWMSYPKEQASNFDQLVC